MIPLALLVGAGVTLAYHGMPALGLALALAGPWFLSDQTDYEDDPCTPNSASGN